MQLQEKDRLMDALEKKKDALFNLNSLAQDMNLFFRTLRSLILFPGALRENIR